MPCLAHQGNLAASWFDDACTRYGKGEAEQRASRKGDAMANDLFIRLEKYGSTTEKRQTENFLTELVGYLLRKEPVAREEFIRLVAGEWGKGKFPGGDAQVHAQYLTASREAKLNGLLLDLVLRRGASELLVENKVGDELGAPQLGKYLDYAREDSDRRVAVVSRSHQVAVDGFRGAERWLGETLWWEIADRWAARKAEFSCKRLIDGVLNFMAGCEMGPIEAFAGEEMKAPELWRRFVETRDAILKRLKKLISEPAWAAHQVLRRYDEYPGSSDRDALDYRGIVWCRPGVKPYKDTFWYFAGFRYRALPGFPPLTQSGEPECCVFVGTWGTPTIREDFETRLEQLNAGLDAPICQVIESEGGGVFLCRRRALKDFLNSENQPATILDFFQTSHERIKDTVPWAYARHQELLRKPRAGDEG